MSEGGPAIPVVAVTDRYADGGPALRVAVVSDGRPTEGGPARPVIVVTDGRPTQGNVPLPVVLATGAQASQVLAGPAIPVVVVSGSLNLNTPPVNTVLPVISGNLAIGQTLSTTDGTWTGTAPITYTYQWKRGGVDIVGATNSTYVVVVADDAATITVTVTATNAAGAVAATSAGVTILDYLLLARYATPEAAPIATPHVDDIGTTTIVQTNGQISIAGGKAVLPVGTNAVFSLGWYGTTNQGRAAGRTLYQTFDITTFADAVPLAWSKAASVNFAGYNNIGVGMYLSSVVPQAIDNVAAATDLLPANLVTGAIYQLAIVQRAAGGFLILEGGIFTRPTLLYPAVGDSTANQYPATSNAKAAYNVDEFAVTNLSGNYTTTYGLATSATASPASGATAPTEIEFLIEFTWTPVALETLEIDLRFVDADNRWIIRCDQAGSTIRLFEREAGVEVQRRTAAQTWTVGTPYRIVASAPVGWYACWVNTVLKWTPYPVPATQPVDLYTTGARVTGFATGANLVTWPRTLSAFAFGLNRPLSSFFILADSKGPYSGFPTTLQKNLSTASSAWANSYPQCDIGSATWAIMAAAIDARLAAHTASAPIAILANLGVNDAVTLPAEATLKANVNYCLDAIHTKWPAATIYLARVWRRSYGAECATLNGWLDDIIAARSDTVAGHNEPVWLENGDDGTTYTSDGVHYNAAGIAQAAIQWQTAMGL